MDPSGIDEALTLLEQRKTWWAQLPIKDKVQYLREVRQLTLQNAERWAEAGAKAKGLARTSPLVGAEEWLAGPYAVAAWITASIQTLQALDSGADPLADVKTWTRPNGTVVARVLPVDVYERLLFNGIEAQVWMQDGVTEANLRDNIAAFYREEDPEGSLALVLGAGNVAAIVPLDILDRMINCGEVVICKMNPVNEYLGPVFEDIFAPLIRDGYLQFVYGGGDVGEYLTRHELVRAIHITGSAVVTQKLHNSGHNCVANQVVVLPSDWEGSEKFLAALRQQLAAAASRKAYYPGTAKQLGDELDRAVARLRYGGIGINIWVGAAFLLARAAWGAFPGRAYADVQSGIGVVHNALMFDRPQKTVVFAPFRPFPRSVAHRELALFPKPPWFLDNKTSESTVRKLTEFAANPSGRRLPALRASALRG